MKRSFSLLVLFVSVLLVGSSIRVSHELSIDVQKFINRMVSVHHFNYSELALLFSKINTSTAVLKNIQHPFEKSSWVAYRKRFVTEQRISEGLKFWQQYADFLQRAEQTFGVPQEIIVAIIGVESLYGKNIGRHNVLQALSTLAFNHEARKGFFLKELEEFLLLCREQGWDPMNIKGSYAGAMGLPQFIASSYRRYAIDFTHLGTIDLLNHAPTAIGSVANYFYKFGWEKQAPIVIPAKIIKGSYINDNIVNQEQPTVNTLTLQKLGVTPLRSLGKKSLVSILRMDGEQEQHYWLGLKNFHVLTKYNRSHLYAMAVYDLSVELANRYYQE